MAYSDTKTDDKSAPQNAPDTPEQGAPQAGANAQKKEPANFSSVFTKHVPDILKQLKISLLVSTYQAGRLIIVRPDDKGGVNTHFVCLEKPMGMATSGNRFAIGTRREIVEYHNVNAAAAKVEPKNTHDACYVPWVKHTTGDVDIHEMAYDKDDELWFINTKFSCLCTRTSEYSFEPRWRPWFISGYAPEDRCHLNGLAMKDGKPKYVSTLGVGDTRGKWREKKATGGTIIDIQKNEFVYEGLSMPHSPRLYRDKLWVLESGQGSLAYVDQKTGKLETVCKLDGFTRGIDFVGDIAFIGLSQIRESNTFGGLPITERLKERICGVWIVNITNGNILGFLRFQGTVQEIFSVQAIRNTQFPAVLDSVDPLVNSTYVLSDKALKDVDFESIKKAEAEAKIANEKAREETQSYGSIGTEGGKERQKEREEARLAKEAEEKERKEKGEDNDKAESKESAKADTDQKPANKPAQNKGKKKSGKKSKKGKK